MGKRDLPSFSPDWYKIPYLLGVCKQRLKYTRTLFRAPCDNAVARPAKVNLTAEVEFGCAGRGSSLARRRARLSGQRKAPAPAPALRLRDRARRCARSCPRSRCRPGAARMGGRVET